MSLTTGTKLGPYEVLAAVGAGGMGEVYRARDARLGRDVAVKVLPPTFANDPDRLRRFEVEARTVAALNHPNILALHDIGEYEGAPYLVCELLEGETLRERMDSGALGQRKAVEYASQIAHGLAAAHEKGVVHRDLKPDNIFLTKDGRLKILDFGLAKLARAHSEAAAAVANVEELTSLTATKTTPGLVLGTAGYMSPEQVRGKEVDARSDIFSFGAVAYEMLSGRRAFRGESSVETMNAILKEDPEELTTTGMHVSPGLDQLVRRCLEKQPEQRFQSARDLAFALEALSHTGVSAALSTAAPKPRWKKWVVAAAAVIAVAAASALLTKQMSAPVHTRYFAIPVQSQVSHMAITRDGSMLAFVSPNENSGQQMLFVQAVGGRTATVLAGTEGAMFPFWSPDNQYIGFFANRKLMKVRASGGAPQRLADVSSPRGGSWGSKDVIIFAAESGGFLWRVNADGTGLALLTEKMASPTEASHRWPMFLPDGEHFLFWGGEFAKASKESGLWLSSLSAKDRRFVVATLSNCAYATGGKLFYVNERGQLLMQNFDAKSGVVSGEARVAAEGVGYDSSLYWAAFTISENGTAVTNTSSAASQSVLTWVDRSGKELGTVGSPGLIFNTSLSPDGERLAVDIDDLKAANVDVWIHDLKRGTATRFTFKPGEEATPVWSPDGMQLSYRSVSDGVVVKPVTGLEREHIWSPLASANNDALPNSWSPDGKALVFTSSTSKGEQHLMVARAGEKAVKVFQGNSNQANGQISPDGKLLAYVSDESGTWEVYVTNFPGAAAKWQVSQGGGTEPRWRGDGKEIFYISAKGVLTAVPVSTDSGFSTGVAQPLFPLRARMAMSSTDVFSYDVTRDGKKFLVNRYVSPAYVAPLDIALHITATDEKK